MSNYTERWNQGAEELRKRLHADSTLSLWGKDPNPPRAPRPLLEVGGGWYALYDSHTLADETGRFIVKRTLDFYLAERAALTDDVANAVSHVLFDGRRYAIATDPWHEVAGARYWRIICVPTGEAS